MLDAEQNYYVHFLTYLQLRKETQNGLQRERFLFIFFEKKGQTTELGFRQTLFRPPCIER